MIWLAAVKGDQRGQRTLSSWGGMDAGQQALRVRDVLADLIDDSVELFADGSILLDFGLELLKQLGVNHGSSHFGWWCRGSLFGCSWWVVRWRKIRVSKYLERWFWLQTAFARKHLEAYLPGEKTEFQGRLS